MSTALICEALGLPPGRWPPDHYTLLGLPAGEVDAAAVEERVLDRMERLRRYQLAHPDAVTDAMNRLAQAMVCLTDPAAKAAYDAGLRPAAAALTVTTVEEDTRPYALAPPESVAVAPVVRKPTPPAPQPRRDDIRRRLYRRLSATRRLLAAWRAAGEYVGTAGRRLTPIDGIEFVGAMLELRARLADEAALPVGLPGQPGSEVAALARQPLPLTVFRQLKSVQRVTLAADWQAGLNRLTAAYAEVGRSVRRHRRSALRRSLRAFARAVVTDRLDLALFVLGLLALGIALCRVKM